MAPVPFSVKVSKIKGCLQPKVDTGEGSGNFPGNESFTAYRTFVVKEDAVTCIHAVGFSIVNGNPVSVKLGGGVWGSWVKWGCLFLWDLLYFPEEL